MSNTRLILGTMISSIWGGTGGVIIARQQLGAPRSSTYPKSQSHI